MRHQQTLRWFFENLTNIQAYRAPDFTIGMGSDADIVFNHTHFDNLGEFNTGTGQFVPQSAGWYHVKVSAHIGMGAGSGFLRLGMWLVAGGCFSEDYLYCVGGQQYTLHGHISVELDAAQAIKVDLYNNSANTITVYGYDEETHIGIARIPVID